MKNAIDISEVIDCFRSFSSKAITFDKEGIHAAYQKNLEAQTLPIKIVSVFGGILASLAFTGFLFLSGVYRSPEALFGFGTVSMIAAIWISRKYSKILLETISISLLAIGFILLGLGLDALGIHGQRLYLTFIVLSLGTLVYVRGYVLIVSNVLLLNGSILALIVSFNADFIHIQTSTLAIVIYYYFLREAKIIHYKKRLSMLYNPIRTGLVFSFLGGLIYLSKKGLIDVSLGYLWITSLVCIAAILFMMTQLFPILNVTSKIHRDLTHVLTVLTLLPTVLSPAISGIILLMLLSFLVHYKTGFVISIVALVYFISQYYYDLNFTLLTKSILLMSSGVFFMVLYLFIRKTFKS